MDPHFEDLVTTFEFLETELKNGPNFEDNTWNLPVSHERGGGMGRLAVWGATM